MVNRNRPDLRAPSPSPAMGLSRGPGALQSIVGDRMPRYSRLLDKMNQGSIIYKVPEAFGADEHNVIFGLGVLAALGAGASGQFTQNAPRDLILRRLQIYNMANVADGDFTVTAITVEGNALMLGGAAGGGAFIPGAFHCPDFNIPVAGGTPVQIQIVNTTAGALDYVATFLID